MAERRTRAEQQSAVVEVSDAALTGALLCVLTWEAAVNHRMPAILESLFFAAFATLLVGRLRLSPRPPRGWALVLEIALLVATFPLFARATGALRLLRLVRLPLAGVRGVTSLKRNLIDRGAVVVLAVTTLTAHIGALSVLEFERGEQIDSLTDALWWAAATMTTVGYGDLSPATTGGRIVAAALMFTGIGLFGLVTALLANWFNAERAAPTTADPAAADRSEIDDRIPADA